jgi:DNA-binding NarL/FixJ family response regulator
VGAPGDRVVRDNSALLRGLEVDAFQRNLEPLNSSATRPKVLRHVAAGNADKKIAQQLRVTEETIKAHMKKFPRSCAPMTARTQ